MRDYDPTTGRYIQGDPLGLVDGASVYGYALQNPGRYTDPTGQFIALLLPLAGAAAGGAAASIALGMLIDGVWGDGCYTRGEAGRDAALGALFGSAGKGASLAWGAWRGGVAAAGLGRGLGGNPFKGKSAQQVDDYLRGKGFIPRGKDPMNGAGTYTHPRTGRAYHNNMNHPPPRTPHVGVMRLRGRGKPGRRGRSGRDYYQ